VADEIEMNFENAFLVGQGGGGQAASGDVDAACTDARSALALAAEMQHADTVWRAKKLAKSLVRNGGVAPRQLWQDVLAAQASTVAEG